MGRMLSKVLPQGKKKKKKLEKYIFILLRESTVGMLLSTPGHKELFNVLDMNSF